MPHEFLLQSWPQAIVHVDADAFFASVEQALHPELRGKPVITGAERGIVAAASYEAKALGIKRGVSLTEATRLAPDLVMLPSDYETYSIFSKRMFSIMRRFSPLVEEYSIDEGFIDLTGTRRLHHTNYRNIALLIQETVEKELGITVSLGVSLTKSLAKLASKFRKPHGLTAVKGRHIHFLLRATPLHRVWGFGPNTTSLLKKHGLKTALDFIQQPLAWVEDLLGKVGHDIWMELRGEMMSRVDPTPHDHQLSIGKTKTFTPPSSCREYVKARAIRNLESACIKARRLGLAARKLVLGLRQQNFETHALEIKLTQPTAAPTELVTPLIALFDRLFTPQTLYRATSVVLGDLTAPFPLQFGLFENPEKPLNAMRLFEVVDAVASKYGKHTLFLADGVRLPLPYETARQRLRFPTFH